MTTNLVDGQVLVARAKSQYAACRPSGTYRGPVKRCAELLYGYYHHATNIPETVEIFVSGRSEFPRALKSLTCDSRIILAGRSFVRLPQSSFTNMFALLLAGGIPEGRTKETDDIRLRRSGDRIVIEAKHRYLDQPAFDAFKASQSDRYAGIKESAKHVDVRPELFRFGHDALTTACRIGLDEISHVFGYRDERFTASISGSYAYGPRLGSDFDFFIIHNGDRRYFDALADEIKAILTETGLSTDNSVECADIGLKSFFEPELGRSCDRILSHYSAPFFPLSTSCIEGVGDPSLFETFRQYVGSHFINDPRCHNMLFWYNFYRKLDRVDSSDHFLPWKLIQKALLMTKMTYTGTILLHHIMPQKIDTHFSSLAQMGIMTPLRAEQIKTSAAYFSRLLDLVQALKLGHVNESNYPFFARSAGHAAQEDLTEEIARNYSVLESEFNTVKTELGHLRASSRYKFAAYAIFKRAHKNTELFRRHFADGDTKIKFIPVRNGYTSLSL